MKEKQAIQHTPVRSSNIKAIGHDPNTRALYVKFRNGGHYVYHDVDLADYSRLMAAESKGKYLHQFIKGKHRHTKLE
jgi:predicted metal-dependent hydrolase